MAKKEELTIEEKLQAALIPKEEQPYEIPDSWVWVRLGAIFEIERGGSPRPISEFLSNREDAINWIKIGDTTKGNKYIYSTKERIKKEGKSRSRYVKVGDLLLTNSMSFGQPYILKCDGCIHDGWLVLRKKSRKILEEFYYHFLTTSYVYRKFSETAKGSTVKNLNKELVKESEIILIPTEEQQRIVKKLDFLFEKTKKAKELIQEVKEEIEMRKISILDKAFRGELTKNWRRENKTGSVLELLQEIQNEKMKKWEEECREAEKNGSKKPKKIKVSKLEEMIVPKEEEPYKIPDSWKWVRLKEVTENNQYGYTSKSNSEGKIKYLRITDIQNENVDWDKVPYIVEENNNISQFFLRKGDIVIARTGSTTGKSYRIDKIEDIAVFASYLIRIRVIKISSEYLLGFTHSNVYWNQIIELSSGIAQPGVNAQKLENLYFPLPPLEEQQEIVRVLEEVLEKEKKVKELIDLEEKIDLLEKSILDKAFRGKLGTQDKNDEPALEVLRKI